VQKNIKAIIFDLGRVLIDFDHWIAARAISEFTDIKPEEIFPLFFDSGIIQSFEEGKISAKDFFSKVKKILKLNICFEEFLPIWNNIFFITEQNKAVYKLAKSLKGKYKVAMLSNVNELHFEYLKKEFPIFDAFDYVLTSYELGRIKPHPEIYQDTLKIIDAEPCETFYVDDRPELIAEAEKLGIRSFVYKGIEQLKKDLASCGVS
jgi:glucose-1-phosphatase